jgi:hypothetical protein
MPEPEAWLLELMMVLSYVLGNYLEVEMVFTLLTANAIIGFQPILIPPPAEFTTVPCGFFSNFGYFLGWALFYEDQSLIDRTTFLA